VIDYSVEPVEDTDSNSMSQLLIILTLVFQPILLQIDLSGMTQSPISSASCCVPVQATTSCGETVLVSDCPMSQGTCACGILPDNPQQPTQAPIERASSSSHIAIAPLHILQNMIPSAPPNIGAQHAPRAHFARTNQTQQALLGVWLT
jgi:hypothetical protein